MEPLLGAGYVVAGLKERDAESRRASRCSGEDFFGKGNDFNLRGTPLKINMEPKSEGLEDGFPFQTGDFQIPCSQMICASSFFC